MRFIVVEDYESLSRKAAEFIGQEIISNPSMVLGLATGSTPLGTYRHLVEDAKSGKLDFSRVTTFNLDEYIGLPPSHEQSYSSFMWRHLFSEISIDPARVHLPLGLFEDAEAACAQYEKLIEQAGGIDLQLLGIGNNGHIGFNEPDDKLGARTHIVRLTEDTIQANARFFEKESEVPREAITMGVGTIMQAKKILLLASGWSKAKAIQQTIHGEVDTEVPSTVLQMHRDVTIIADFEAASLLDLSEVYICLKEYQPPRE